jgi:hypothetical protein
MMYDEPFYIVAGTRKEFEDFVIRKNMMGLYYNWKYVWNADMLRGLNRIRGFYVGTYEEREDWPQIELAIQTIKSKGG